MVCGCVYVGGSAHGMACMCMSEENSGVCSFLPPSCGFWGWNSGRQAYMAHVFNPLSQSCQLPKPRSFLTRVLPGILIVQA